MPQSRRLTWAALVAGAVLLLAGTPEGAQAQRRCRVADVAVAPTNDEVGVGETHPFTATGFDASGSPCDNITWTWTSSNAAIATIGADGIAHGVAPGTVVITARTGTGATVRAGTATLTVNAAVHDQSTSASTSMIPGFAPVLGRPSGPGYAAWDRQPEGSGPADGLFVDPLQLPMVRGEWRAIDFHAVRGTDGQNAQRVPILFSVDAGGERIVSVDSFGIVTSLGEAGSATVRLTVPNQPRIAQKQVRVDVRPDTLKFNRMDFSLAPGATETLSVFIPAQARALNNPSLFQFRSSDPAILRVNPVNPIIEAVAPGTARVIAQSSIYPEIIATVHVHARVAQLRFEPADTTRLIPIGGQTTVRATALAEDGSPVAAAPITWRSPDTSIVSFDTAGVARGRRSGVATITATVPTMGDQGITRMVRIHVVAGGLAVAGGRTRFGVGVGERWPLEVTMLDDARRPVGSANSYLTWTVTPDSVLRVENGNEIVPLRPGRARVVGRTAAPWDSSVTLDVFVVGEMLVSAQNQGRRDLLMKWNGGQNWMPLTSDSAIELQSTWAPDLTRIAFTARQPSPPNQRNAVQGAALFIMQADGTGRVRLTPDSARIQFPSFLPSGDKIVYESNRSGLPQVWVMDLRGDSVLGERQLTTLTPAAGNMSPAVSRDGQRLAYLSVREVQGRRGYGLYLAAIDGTGERLRTTAPGGQTLDNPAFSPDGRTIYFLRTEQRPQGKRVFKLPVDGAPTDSAVAVTPVGLFVNSFSVSADGLTLALATQEPAQGNQPVPLHVMLFPIATGQAQAIDTTPDERPASPTFRPPTPRPAAPTNR